MVAYQGVPLFRIIFCSNLHFAGKFASVAGQIFLAGVLPISPSCNSIFRTRDVTPEDVEVPSCGQEVQLRTKRIVTSFELF